MESVPISIKIPVQATGPELMALVLRILEAVQYNYVRAARVCGCSPALIWKIEAGEVMDSQMIRDRLGILRYKPRLRSHIDFRTPEEQHWFEKVVCNNLTPTEWFRELYESGR